jgi:hypothetical protein
MVRMCKIYFFKGGGHLAKLRVNTDGSFDVATEVTSYQFFPISRLVGVEKYKQLVAMTREMDDAPLRDYVIREFKGMGYTLAGEQVV